MLINAQLSKIYNVFNEELFYKILGDFVPDCIITLQRKTNMYSEMNHNNFVDLETNKKMSEIVINPQWFGVKPRIEILQYVVHQMVHVYQHAYGEPAGKGKHDEQFLDYMNAIGLMPSDTGLPDGKCLGGKKVFNYPMPDGAFLRVSNELAEAGELVSWFELEKPKSFSVDALVKELYLKKEMLDGCVHASLLHVPLLISQNIDVDALLDCLKMDDSQKEIVVDRAKASKLADEAIKSNRDAKNEEEWRNIRQSELGEKPCGDKLSTGKASQATDNIDTEHSDDKPSTFSDDLAENESDLLGGNFHIAEHDTFDDGTAGDAADIFLKRAMDNKPEKFETVAHPGQQKVVKSMDEIASVLGLASAAGEVKKPANKRDFKYTCSCDKTIKGGLGMSVICGHCQLHFICETIEKEVNVAMN